MEMDFENGVLLLIDKPLTWTSFDVVRKVRNILKVKKIGHAGTLDPLATGLLILCTGKFTKRIEEIQAQEKEYTGTFTIGQTTPSYDLETDINQTCDYTHLRPEDLQAAVHPFIGKIEQVPPLYSAVKIDGQRAYKLARRGEEAEIKAKTIEIKSFELTAIEGPVVSFLVVCSKGTYIRSLARDFGQALGCGAHLSSLRRTRIGEYNVSAALTIEDIMEIRKRQTDQA